MRAERQARTTASVERRSIAVLLLILLPLLWGLVHWLNLPGDERLAVGGMTQAYADPGGTLTLADLLATPERLSPANGVPPNLGVRTSPQGAFWLKLPLAPLRALGVVGNAPQMLSFEEPRFRRVDLFVVKAGETVESLEFVRDASAGHRFPVFALPPELFDADAIYARIVTASSMRATLYLAPAPAFDILYARATIGLVLLVGVLAASVAFLLPLGLVLRHGTYLTLGAALLFAMLYVASDQALLETYLLPGAVRLSRGLSLAATVLFYAAFLGFSARFLQFGRWSRRLRQLTDGVAALVVLVGIAAFADGLLDTGLLRRGLPYIGIGATLLLVGLLLAGLRQAPRRAVLFLVMWLPLLVAGLNRVRLDMTPGQGADPVALNGIYFGFALSLLLFAVVTPLELYRRELRLRQRAQSLLARLESFAVIGRDIYFETDAGGGLVYLAGDGSKIIEPEGGATLAQAIDGGLPARSRTALAAALAGARPLGNHIFSVGEANDLRWFSLRGAPAAEAARYRGIVRDVTDEIEAENRRQQEQHLIALGGLAATVAHEINNVVQPIINMSKGLRTHATGNAAAGRMLDLIDLAAQQAAVLVGRILKVGAHRPELATEAREIDHAVRDAVETLRLILPASLTLETRIEPVPGVMVRPGEMLQMLLNIVANARRAAGDSGTVRIELGTGPDGAVLAVTDHGSGMDSAALQRATEPFFTTKPGGAAAGIGLAVVRQLAEAHGGTLHLTSTPGHGTRVELGFPRLSGAIA